MDINGNGYPDWLEEVDGSIVTQYTKATGTLGEDRMKLNVSRQDSKQVLLLSEQMEVYQNKLRQRTL